MELLNDQVILIRYNELNEKRTDKCIFFGEIKEKQKGKLKKTSKKGKHMQFQRGLVFFC